MVAIQPHVHPFRRSAPTMTRNQFLRRGALLAGGLAGYGMFSAPRSYAVGSSAARPARRAGEPKPIPGGFDANFNPTPAAPLVHVLPPAIGSEMSTITDFNGVVGAMEARGLAHGSDGSEYWFDVDMRFMKGVYVDTVGRMQEHAFGFV
jgi:hypothetical protein